MEIIIRTSHFRCITGECMKCVLWLLDFYNVQLCVWSSASRRVSASAPARLTGNFMQAIGFTRALRLTTHTAYFTL